MITLALGPRSASFRAPGGFVSDALPLGPALLRERWLRHDPPQPQELEAAIEAVEDLVMPLHGRWPADASLHVVFAQSALLPIAGAELTRDQLELLFDRAAAIVLGRPGSSDPALADADAIAELVILREVMHHLGFTGLVLARA
jgi:hypothetical protein